jgi:hypothetical protein
MPSRPYFLFAAAVALAAVLGLAGCDASGTSAFREDVVVESYQTAGEALAPVRLTRSSPIGAAFDYDRLAVRGAEVAVERLGAGGAVADRVAYRADPDSAGLYRPTAGPGGRVPRVEPLATYRLDVRLPEAVGGGRLRATTVVPDTFRVVAASRTRATYREGPPLSLRVTRSRYPGRDQAYYILAVEALDVREDNLTPLAAEVFAQAAPDDLTLDDLRIVSTPAINAAGYTQNADGTLTVSLPWAQIVFYGDNVIQLSALDDNLYDFVRSLNAQQNGIDPGTIPNVIERVDGGIGVFGSLAVQRVAVVIDRRAED